MLGRVTLKKYWVLVQGTKSSLSGSFPRVYINSVATWYNYCRLGFCLVT